MNEKEYTTEFQKALNDYIKLGFNQDECNGFMHGFHKGAEAVKKLNIDDVSNCFTETDKRLAYNKGYKDGKCGKDFNQDSCC